MVPLRTIIVTSAVAFLLAPGALAQNSSRTFHLTTVSTLAGLNEMATIIRTLGVGSPTSDAASQSITVEGTDANLALAAWLVEQLDSEHPQSAEPQYTIAGSSQDAVRIFYLINTPTMAGLNELVTSLRILADIQRIFTYSPPRAIVLRTTAANAQLAEWLVQQLDVSPANHPSKERYADSGPGGPGEVVEVVYLAHQGTQTDLNQAATMLRSDTGIRYIFTRSTPQGIAFRGTSDQVQSAERLLQQIDAQ